MLNDVYKTLRNRFIAICVVLLVLLLATFLYHRSNMDHLTRAGYALTMVCFFGSAIFSACIPIIIRLLTFKKVKDDGNISKKSYLNFKKLVSISAFVGALFAIYGYYAMIYDALLTVTILFAMYGIYSIIPSKKAVNMELVEFNVEDYNNKK
jgi:amino acid transporter